MARKPKTKEPTAVKTRPALHIRWMIRRDMPEVLAIEEASYYWPWTEEQFFKCLRQRNCIGMVAEHDERVVGFMVYCLNKTSMVLLNMAVATNFREQQVGARMICRLINRLHEQRLRRIIAEPSESNLAAHLFFKHLGFVCDGILTNYYDDQDPPQDAYSFVYRSNPETNQTILRRYGYVAGPINK